MSIVSSGELLDLWEATQGRHSLDKALALCAVCCPEFSFDELAELSVGERDGLLLRIYQHRFGPRLKGYIECPECGERLEFTLSTTDVTVPYPAEKHDLRFCDQGYEVVFCLPNSHDLSAIARLTDLDGARRILFQSCIQAVFFEGQAAAFDDLPEDLLARLADRLLELDSQAEILLDFDCAACRHHWQALLDILDFFWLKLKSQVRRVVTEVHLLAQAYSWSEQQILAMSPQRRQIYLELVGL